jgi:hypothetical protein
MNTANNHPSVQNAKQTVMNGKVCTHNHLYLLWTMTNGGLAAQILECAHTTMTKLYRSRCAECQGRGRKDPR